VLNEAAPDEARRADRERSAGADVGPLHGLPFVVKDSFAVAGLTQAAGSPAFAELIAREDASTVALLREAGAIVLGKTTMPPMAAGGMQLGVYGKPRSPYNPDYLPAGWLSGSSSGSAVAVAAGLCAFGLAEETLSSGRSPASNNALAAYVPSRGLISLRGNWPLMSLRDQVAPHARSVDDLLHVLDVLVPADDRDPAGGPDLWRDQEAVELPAPSTVRPPSYLDLCDPDALRGATVGVPRLFVGRDRGADGSATFPLRSSVRRLWERAEDDLRALGAKVVEVDPPAFTILDDIGEETTLADLGYWSADFPPLEWVRLIASSWDAFLRQNGDPTIPDLASVPDFTRIFPEEFHGLGPEFNPMGRYDYAGIAAEAAAGTVPMLEIEGIDEALRGLERFRRDHHDDWMRREGIDLLAFPAHTGAGPAAADRDPDAAAKAWRPGVNYALGGTAMRLLAIPSAVVPMGLMDGPRMPVGITFAGPAYEDSAVLAAAYAYEAATRHRVDPPLGG
jgi:amidase